MPINEHVEHTARVTIAAHEATVYTSHASKPPDPDARSPVIYTIVLCNNVVVFYLNFIIIT